MSKFYRYFIPNAIVFITCVTYNRVAYLLSQESIDIFWDTLRNVKRIYPFRLLAYVILPDHFHWLMQVDDKKGDFAKVMQSFKRNFTLNYKKQYKISTPLTIWQSRYWDHVIRNQFDLQKHFDYIHWNPIKHGLVDSVEDWPCSSFSYWYDRGFYTANFSQSAPPEEIANMDFE